ncbi:MAG: sigma-54-dependent Fis family transcriptional regulator [Deltaproteobacteria bacterium]|nr:sigma-54-dependent Fis family transcriptional regulator [Deltaproteobacteria bacterium]MBW2015834.1 sigma-54-dependent Fis family transcriptional regulator [Deltaproteobacteria bacterium]MBW2128853.1 sigma-54-dependent Fis family transcriptional regulator [Deltaproteobacteria bacterium]MBW2304440.1 sigma-54-dependent Fis family transcriptional regulator [Deltaproteobacteria bacterium]
MINRKATILVVDDERGIRESFRMVLKDTYHVLFAATAKEALDTFIKSNIDLILLDILLPDASGLDLLDRFKSIDPNAEVIMVTAVKEIKTAVQAIKLGAYEYLVKPFVVEDVLNCIHRALEKHKLLKEVTYLRNELERYHPFEAIIGQDEKMKEVFDLVSTIAGSEGAVFIYGESGTGKELIARAIHNLSPRKDQPFVVINCAAIPSSLMESELFGHRKGAFTGATQTTMGKLEIADKGTVFLDDIDTLDINMQAKLLRVIQEKEFQKLGTTKVIKIDVRFLAATNKDVGDLISQGKFREDLYYRLNVFPITLPPLRKRKKDIPLLLDHFLELNAKRTGKPPKRFSKAAVKALTEYDWPGNVRELQNLVERAFTISKNSVIHFKELANFHTDKRPLKHLPLKKAVSHFEYEYISDVLEHVGNNRKRAAEILGIHRNTLLAKITELGINTGKKDEE